MLEGRGRFVAFALLFFLIISGITTFSELNKSNSSLENAVESAQSSISISPTESLATPTTTSIILISKKPSNLSSQNLQPGKKEQVLVLKVVDGDTLSVNINGKKETIRVIGINTPEIVDPRRPVECFGKEASDMAKSLLSGQTVWLYSDPTQTERDKYDRLLRYVNLSDDSDYGKKMIEEGYAYEYTYEVPYQKQGVYRIAQSDAEAAKRGLWSNSTCSVSIDSKPLNVVYPTSSASGGGDKDCKDFSTQNEAQEYFNSKGGSNTNNVDKLDGSDHDGIVCETLP